MENIHDILLHVMVFKCCLYALLAVMHTVNLENVKNIVIHPKIIDEAVQVNAILQRMLFFRSRLQQNSRWPQFSLATLLRPALTVTVSGGTEGRRDGGTEGHREGGRERASERAYVYARSLMSR